jgi:hypothetical protein
MDKCGYKNKSKEEKKERWKKYASCAFLRIKSPPYVGH